jgi:hypothetical protein
MYRFTSPGPCFPPRCSICMLASHQVSKTVLKKRAQFKVQPNPLFFSQWLTPLTTSAPSLHGLASPNRLINGLSECTAAGPPPPFFPPPKKNPSHKQSRSPTIEAVGTGNCGAYPAWMVSSVELGFYFLLAASRVRIIAPHLLSVRNPRQDWTDTCDGAIPS